MDIDVRNHSVPESHESACVLTIRLAQLFQFFTQRLAFMFHRFHLNLTSDAVPLALVRTTYFTTKHTSRISRRTSEAVDLTARLTFSIVRSSHRSAVETLPRFSPRLLCR